jgi:hypothetical protein
VNGAKVYDPADLKNHKVYASNGAVVTDAGSKEKVSWYKTKWGIIGIAATFLVVGTVAGFAIYNHNKKDADIPAGDGYTPPPTPPGP